MSYENLRGMLAKARAGGYAVGAFNCVDYVTTAAIIKAAAGNSAPVIVQTSPKTVKTYGFAAIVNWVKPLAEAVSVPVALHLDHCKELEMIRKCIDAGWSSVMIDASAQPYETNVAMTAEAVRAAAARDVTVEGELGMIPGVEDDLSVQDRASYLADPAACVKYKEATGVDVLAPAIGTAHGLYREEPKVDFDRLGEIARRTEIPLAVHGGTGLAPEVFRRCVASGGAKINISTEIKHVFRAAIESFYRENPQDYEPTRLVQSLEAAVVKTVGGFMDIFGSVGRG